MKVVDNPTIELEEKDIETIKKIRELIINMPCSSLVCGKCPFSKICDYVDDSCSGENATILTIQRALNEAVIK